MTGKNATNILSTRGMRIDPTAITNPKLKMILQRRERDFMFNYSEGERHTDTRYDDADHRDHSEYKERPHDDYNAGWSDSSGG